MGYTLQAFIGEQAVLEKLAFENAKVIALTDRVSLVPMIGELYDEINQLQASPSIDGILFLNENVEREILKRVGYDKIAYITADYAGGIGGQCGVVWQNGEREMVQPFGPGVINEILRQFGVVGTGSRDEFEVTGLNRFRSTEDWLEE